VAAAANAQQEEHLMRLNEIDELESNLADANRKRQRAESDVGQMRRRLDDALSELMSFKSEICNFLKAASRAFRRKFGSLEILATFIAARPHFDAQGQLEEARLKDREQILRRRYQSQKAALRSAQIEIAHL
jgi:vacuolar-type H+-ATPase subunit I/STV1